MTDVYDDKAAMVACLRAEADLLEAYAHTFRDVLGLEKRLQLSAARLLVYASQFERLPSPSVAEEGHSND